VAELIKNQADSLLNQNAWRLYCLFKVIQKKLFVPDRIYQS